MRTESTTYLSMHNCLIRNGRWILTEVLVIGCSMIGKDRHRIGSFNGSCEIQSLLCIECLLSLSMICSKLLGSTSRPPLSKAVVSPCSDEHKNGLSAWETSQTRLSRRLANCRRLPARPTFKTAGRDWSRLGGTTASVGDVSSTNNCMSLAWAY